jgi:hypothetical protein
LAPRVSSSCAMTSFSLLSLIRGVSPIEAPIPPTRQRGAHGLGSRRGRVSLQRSRRSARHPAPPTAIGTAAPSASRLRGLRCRIARALLAKLVAASPRRRARRIAKSPWPGYTFVPG